MPVEIFLIIMLVTLKLLLIQAAEFIVMPMQLLAEAPLQTIMQTTEARFILLPASQLQLMDRQPLQAMARMDVEEPFAITVPSL